MVFRRPSQLDWNVVLYELRTRSIFLSWNAAVMPSTAARTLCSVSVIVWGLSAAEYVKRGMGIAEPIISDARHTAIVDVFIRCPLDFNVS